jgi:hypothetical protein
MSATARDLDFLRCNMHIARQRSIMQRERPTSDRLCFVVFKLSLFTRVGKNPPRFRAPFRQRGRRS